jgi:hypothetical protein
MSGVTLRHRAPRPTVEVRIRCEIFRIVVTGKSNFSQCPALT